MENSGSLYDQVWSAKKNRILFDNMIACMIIVFLVLSFFLVYTKMALDVCYRDHVNHIKRNYDLSVKLKEEKNCFILEVRNDSIMRSYLLQNLQQQSSNLSHAQKEILKYRGQVKTLKKQISYLQAILFAGGYVSIDSAAFIR